MATAAKLKPVTPPRLIRDPEFAKRIESAANGHNLCPAMHSGRLTWVQRELKSRFGEEISVETVRKWFAGEAKPRPEKTAMLAELFQVDVAWLQIGVQADLTPRERKQRSDMAEGAVNLVAGLIQMDGGHPAFPDTTGTVDLHAIIRGAKYDLVIRLADESGGFSVPVDHTDTIVLGVVKQGFAVEVYEIPEDVIERDGVRRGGSIEVKVPLKKLRRIDTFTQRL